MTKTHISLQPNCSDASEICELFQTVFGAPVTPRLWRWKYQQAPAQCTLHALARQSDSGRLVGHAGMTVFKGFWQCRPIHMAQVTDVMVHPTHRSDLGADNLYRRMMHALQQGLRQTHDIQETIVYGFPGQRPATLGIKMGFYRPVSRIAQITLPTSANRSILNRTLSAWQCRATPVAAPSPQWLDHWASRSSRSQKLPHLEKNAAYLFWRYLQHPTLSYQLWALHRHGWGDAGWIITRLEPSPTLIDTCLHPALNPAQNPGAWQALGAALSNVKPGSIFTAWTPPEASTSPQELSPIYPVEIASHSGFHPQQPQLNFQPGDTDVF